MLWAAASHGHEDLVLGAFGCGAFMHDAEEVATRFSALLHGEFAGRFRVVLFAIIKSRYNLEAFSARFPMLSDADTEAFMGRVDHGAPTLAV